MRLRANVYIGDVTVQKEKGLVFCGGKFVQESFDFCFGLYHIVNEILQNSRDHVINDKDCDKILMFYENGNFKVLNNGNGIPIEKSDYNDLLIPEVVFGVLNSSSNYTQDTEKDERKTITGGQNGLGAKLTNLYSDYFAVETVHQNAKGKKLRFFQEYRSRMTQKTEAEVTISDKAHTYTSISFRPCYEFFKFAPKDINENYLQKLLIDIAFSLLAIKRVQVYYNQALLPTPDTAMYASMLGLTQQFVFEHGSGVGSYRGAIACASKASGRAIGFVNSLQVDAGKHVDYVLKLFAEAIQDAGKFPDDAKKTIKRLLRANVTLLISLVIPRPRFDSQTKERLTNTQLPELQIPRAAFRKSEFCAAIVAVIAGQLKTAGIARMKSADKKNLHKIAKLHDAHYAGTDRWKQCSLILTEGDSANGFANAGIVTFDAERQKYFGRFVIGGKFLNVKNKSEEVLNKSQHFNDLRQVLGLTGKGGSESQKLRYGRVILMTDQDFDGFHIKGLMLNMFHKYWKYLLSGSFVYSYRTPVVRVFRNSTGGAQQPIADFYNFNQFKEWLEANHRELRQSDRFTIKYFKGLATSNEEAVKESFSKFDLNLFRYTINDEQDEQYVVHAFDRKLADVRKQKIRDFQAAYVDYERVQTVSCRDYVEKELMHFWRESTVRAIPQLYDGLKQSQRQILATAQKYFAKVKNQNASVKVSVFAAEVTAYANYHYGESSLQKTIIGMAQNFQNTNNFEYFVPDGMFGNVIQGDDAAGQPRYIAIKKRPAIEKIYPAKFLPVLQYDIQEEENRIPTSLFGIVPMLLVNGVWGIACGFSSFVPQFAFDDVLRVLLEILTKKLDLRNSKINLTPHYKYHSANFTEIGDHKWEHIPNFRIVPERNTVIIEELPLYLTYESFKQNTLAPLLDDGILVEIEDPICDKFIVPFKLHFDRERYDLMQKNKADIVKLLKLRKTIEFSNAHMFIDSAHFPTKIDNLNQIYYEYVKWGLRVYQAYKDHELLEMRRRAEMLALKAKFVQLILDEKIKYKNQTTKQISASLTAHKIPDETELNRDIHSHLQTNTTMRQLHADLVQKLENDNLKIQEEIKLLAAKAPEELWIADLNSL